VIDVIWGAPLFFFRKELYAHILLPFMEMCLNFYFLDVLLFRSRMITLVQCLVVCLLLYSLSGDDVYSFFLSLGGAFYKYKFETCGEYMLGFMEFFE